jgi:hypothetical protein
LIVSTSGDLPDSAYDSDDDALRAPADDAPIEERVLYTIERVKIGLAAQRRMRAQIANVAADVKATAVSVGEAATDVDNLRAELAEVKGVVIRVESILLTWCARLENYVREGAAPPIEQLQKIRADQDKIARSLEKRAIRVDERMGDLDRRVGLVEGDVRDTSKHVAVTAERAFEALAHERDSVVDQLEKARERVEEKAEAKVEKHAHVIAEREGRRFELAKVIAAPVLLVALGFLAGKLQACTGVAPVHIPAPAVAPPH